MRRAEPVEVADSQLVCMHRLHVGHELPESLLRRWENRGDGPLDGCTGTQQGGETIETIGLDRRLLLAVSHEDAGQLLGGVAAKHSQRHAGRSDSFGNVGEQAHPRAATSPDGNRPCCSWFCCVHERAQPATQVVGRPVDLRSGGTGEQPMGPRAVIDDTVKPERDPQQPARDHIEAPHDRRQPFSARGQVRQAGGAGASGGHVPLVVETDEPQDVVADRALGVGLHVRRPMGTSQAIELLEAMHVLGEQRNVGEPRGQFGFAERGEHPLADALALRTLPVLVRGVRHRGDRRAGNRRSWLGRGPVTRQRLAIQCLPRPASTSSCDHGPPREGHRSLR